MGSLRASTVGLAAAVLLSGAGALAQPAPAGDPGWKVAGVADFDGDAKADLVWRHDGGAVDVNLMDGGRVRAEDTITVAGTSWKIATTGDFDGDGKADLFWRNASTGEHYVYLLDGTSIRDWGSPNSAPVGWNVAGSGDFDGDGKDDVLLRHGSTGQLYVYLMNGKAIGAHGSAVASTPASWKIAGVGDFDGDGRDDVFWRNDASGANAIYFMNGKSVRNVATVATAAKAWTIVGVPDADGNGKADVVWRHGSTGEIVTWLMNGAAIAKAGSLSTIADSAWRVVGTGDLDGDGKEDLVWRHFTTLATAGWFLKGTTVPGFAFLRSPPWYAGTPALIRDARIVNVLHTDLVHDPARNLLYAYVPKTSDEHPNTIAIVDPETGSVLFSGPIGVDLENTGAMSVSDDGAYLYVGAADAPVVVRYVLPEIVEDQRIELGVDRIDPDWYGEMFARSIAISPLDSKRIAVPFGSHLSTGHRGIAVYQDGIEVAWEVKDNGYYYPDRPLAIYGETGDAIYTASNSSPDTIAKMRIEDAIVFEVDRFQSSAVDSIAPWMRMTRAPGWVLTPGGALTSTPALRHERDLFMQSNWIGTRGGCRIVDPEAEIAMCWDLDPHPTASAIRYQAVNFYSLHHHFPYLIVRLTELPDGGGIADYYRQIVGLANGRVAMSAYPRFAPEPGRFPIDGVLGNERIIILQSIPQPPA